MNIYDQITQQIVEAIERGAGTVQMPWHSKTSFPCNPISGTSYQGINTLILARAEAFDPYPFIFLNLVLSMIAAIQAPIIMMSQNRQSERDRFFAAKDYEVNLKAEIEVMALHHKIDMAVLKELQDLKADVARLSEEVRVSKGIQ